MQPIKDKELVYAILLEDGSYWLGGGISNKVKLRTTLNLSMAAYLSFDNASGYAEQIRGKRISCEVVKVQISVVE
ncbi:hypothetical protein JCM17380_23050 [Desulfosporosinus burensis]